MNDTTNKRTIPLVDLSHYTAQEGQVKNEFIAQLKMAFHEIGFVGVVGHQIDPELINRFYKASQAFFALPDAIKRKYEIPGMAGQRGFTSFGKEHAKQSEVADLKEFFQIGQEVTDQDPIKETYPANVTVAEVPEFLQLGIQLYKAFEEMGGHLLRAIAVGLGLEASYFDAKVHNGNSILRAIHYPPIRTEPKNAIRARTT